MTPDLLTTLSRTDDWDGIGQTAICANCGIAAVIGRESDYPITSEFLDRMLEQWF
jgi:hypothetical protein